MSCWISPDELSSIRDQLDQALALQSNEDPIEKPFDSKYEARKILKEILKEISDRDQNDDTRAVESHLYSMIGCIDIDTEEFSAGEQNLSQALDKSKLVENVDLVIIAKLKTLNQLGILWSFREDYEKAGGYLENALSTYQQFTDQTCNEKCAFEIEELLLSPDVLSLDRPYVQKKKLILDQLNTYTYYYLGQVYEKLGNQVKASEYLHITLKRQLQMKDYDPLDWSLNAAMLASFYLSHDNFLTSRHLLSGAQHIFKEWMDQNEVLLNQDNTNELFEKVSKCKAFINRTCGKYCHLLLQTSVEKLGKNEQESENKSDSNSEVLSDEFPELEMPVNAAKTFEEARSAFVPGQKFYNESKLYFTLEEHCIDFTEINQDLSRMYMCLIIFESDSDRKYQMLKRAAQLLEIPFKELNPQPYLLICRQIAFELGEIYSGMVDLKLAKLQSRSVELTTHDSTSENINKLISLSQHSYKTFVSLVQTEDGKYPVETCRPALLAMLNLARLANKIIVYPALSNEKLIHILESYKYYKQFSDYCKTHPDGEESVAQELPLCDEMLTLLPVKIQRMKQELELELPR